MKKYKLIIIILVVLVSILFLVGFYYNYQISPVDRDGEKVVVEIKEGTVSSIGDTLYENGLIENRIEAGKGFTNEFLGWYNEVRNKHVKDSDTNGARIDSITLFIIKMYSVIYRLQA